MRDALRAADAALPMLVALIVFRPNKRADARGQDRETGLHLRLGGLLGLARGRLLRPFAGARSTGASFGAYFCSSFCFSASRASRVACWSRMRKSRSLSPGFDTSFVSASLNRSSVWVAKIQRANSFSHSGVVLRLRRGRGQRAERPARVRLLLEVPEAEVGRLRPVCQSTGAAPSVTVASTVTPRALADPQLRVLELDRTGAEQPRRVGDGAGRPRRREELRDVGRQHGPRPAARAPPWRPAAAAQRVRGRRQRPPQRTPPGPRPSCGAISVRIWSRVSGPAR